jgi:hypothetical protein
VHLRLCTVISEVPWPIQAEGVALMIGDCALVASALSQSESILYLLCVQMANATNRMPPFLSELKDPRTKDLQALVAHVFKDARRNAMTKATVTEVYGDGDEGEDCGRMSLSMNVDGTEEDVAATLEKWQQCIEKTNIMLQVETLASLMVFK